MRVLVLLAFLIAAPTLSAGESALARLSGEIRDLAAKAGPAVARVSVEREIHLPDAAVPGPRLLTRSHRLGTGFLVSSRGLVITTARLAEGAERARVVFPDGLPREGRILGTAPFFDVAVVKIDPVAEITPLALATEADPAFGALAIFLGYSYGTSRNVSLGLVTGTGVAGPAFDNYLTLNARQAPGDTGGPFLDPQGRVVGMAVGAPGAFSFGLPGEGGPAHAVPAADIAFAVREIEVHGRVRTGRLGINVMRQDLRVKDVHPGTPAEAAGILPGDLLAALDGTPLADATAFARLLHRIPAGREIALTVRRDEAERVFRLALEDFVPAALAGISVAVTADGLAVRQVEAEEARFDARVGDRILAVDGRSAESGDGLLALIRAAAGPPATIEVVRAGERVTLEARTGE